MDSVMINQLPELVIPRNRTFTTVNKTTTPHFMEKRNPYISKWYVLFDNKNDQWISFKPKPGQNVYPCYACRDMFGGRESFLDHVNRRGLLLKYRCGVCRKNLIFYNTCSFLLHAREHFSDNGGKIDLDYVEISSIPMEIAGFLPISNIPRLYDTDAPDNENIVQSVKFYKALPTCAGKRVVHFQPFDLLFFPSPNQNNITDFKNAMVIRQINSFIPKCLFVLITTDDVPKLQTQQPQKPVDSEESESDSDIICLDEDTNTPFTQKIQVKSLNSMRGAKPDSDSENEIENENLLEEQQNNFCFECGRTIPSLLSHFQVGNKPFMDQLKCKKCGLISTSACSLKAHLRIHDKQAPYVCPECGQLYKNWDELNNHMEFKCFHTAKTVRFKCPAKKCGKIFAQTMTFSSHFPFAHIQVRSGCSVCGKYFHNDLECEQHGVKEGHHQPVLKIHECTVCQRPADDIKKHVLNHVQNRNNRIYVFICKYCRSYYRSKQTYAVHLLKCSKLLLNSQVKKEVLRIDSHNDLKCKVIKYCKPCHCKIQFHCSYKDIRRVASCCPRCSHPFEDYYRGNPTNLLEYTVNPFVRKNADTCNFICVMCNEILGRDFNPQEYAAKHSCKYQNAVVIVNVVNVDVNLEDKTTNNVNTNTTTMIANATPSPTNKKKRKRLLQAGGLKKRVSTDPDPVDIIPSEPIVFDGEYKCGLCSFSHESRKIFHEHIQEHRDVSTSYQCMECGECFVVKPSLLKHLQVFHLIEDQEEYINSNECFDKEAVRLLEENMRMVPGEVNEPVAENQCRVCRQFFSDTQELSKHFRVHGMAFLMKKIK